MLDQLLETRAAPQRRRLGTALSIVLHAVLGAPALWFTHRDAVALEKPHEVVVRHQPRRDQPEPLRTVSPASPLAPTTSYLGFQLVIAPVSIPIDIPPADLGAPASEPADFTGTDAPGGRGSGDGGGLPGIGGSGESPYLDVQVEKVAAAMPGSATPAYPELLKSAGVEGEVVVQFVVDTTGRAELASFRVLRSTNEGFTQAVRQVLPRMRYLPAEIEGRKVRMVVSQPYVFSLAR